MRKHAWLEQKVLPLRPQAWADASTLHALEDEKQ